MVEFIPPKLLGSLSDPGSLTRIYTPLLPVIPLRKKLEDKASRNFARSSIDSPLLPRLWPFRMSECSDVSKCSDVSEGLETYVSSPPDARDDLGLPWLPFCAHYDARTAHHATFCGHMSALHCPLSELGTSTPQKWRQKIPQ